jgi:hypothetical protein
VVDRLGKAELVDESLEAALQEILSLEGQDVIELHAGLVEDTDADKAANEGVAFEETLGVLLVESKELTASKKLAKSPPPSFCSNHHHLPSSTTNLGEGEEHTPHLTLVAETILANELQLGVPEYRKLVQDHNRHKRRQAAAQWPVMIASMRRHGLHEPPRRGCN